MNHPVIAFVIPGTPIGKARPKFARRGNFVMTYTPERTANYENLVRLKAVEAMRGRAPLDGPVAVEIRLCVTPPTSWSGKKTSAALAHQIRPTTKPDVDNVIKVIFDAMNEVVWRDDRQVCELRVVKLYSTSASAQVDVRPIAISCQTKTTCANHDVTEPPCCPEAPERRQPRRGRAAVRREGMAASRGGP